MSDAVTVALIFVLGPLMLALLTNRQRRRERAEDYARQDAVAAATFEVAQKAATVADDLAASTSETIGKIDGLVGDVAVVHGLVNSNMTAQMQSDLDSNRRNLVLLRDIRALRAAAGQETDDDAEVALVTTRIAELEAAIKDRLRPETPAEPSIKETP